MDNQKLQFWVQSTTVLWYIQIHEANLTFQWNTIKYKILQPSIRKHFKCKTFPGTQPRPTAIGLVQRLNKWQMQNRTDTNIPLNTVLSSMSSEQQISTLSVLDSDYHFKLCSAIHLEDLSHFWNMVWCQQDKPISTTLVLFVPFIF